LESNADPSTLAEKHSRLEALVRNPLAVGLFTDEAMKLFTNCWANRGFLQRGLLYKVEVRPARKEIF
jgi:hypothetical protein